jgi:peroxiredoxin
MKKAISKVLIVLMSCIIFASCGSQTEKKANTAQPDDRGYIVKIGDKAPDFTTLLQDSTVFTLSDNLGKVVMLQFTASWCGVCRKEMPHIEKDVWLPLKDKGLVLVGVDRGEPIQKVIDFSKKMEISYPLALDEDSEIFALYALKNAGVTRNVIIDKEGKIAFLTRLFNEDEFKQMIEVIKELLE